jgi:hypothetical protein
MAWHDRFFSLRQVLATNRFSHARSMGVNRNNASATGVLSPRAAIATWPFSCLRAGHVYLDENLGAVWTMDVTAPPHVIITGASSGVGLHATKALVDRGWHVVMACRDLAKAARAAARLEINLAQVTLLEIDLGALASVRRFAADFAATGKPLDALVCNAAVYLPLLKTPARSPEGYEISVATNHFGHFLFSHLLLREAAGHARHSHREFRRVRRKNTNTGTGQSGCAGRTGGGVSRTGRDDRRQGVQAGQSV